MNMGRRCKLEVYVINHYIFFDSMCKELQFYDLMITRFGGVWCKIDG